MKEYYTVKEISKRLEISVQATYGRIKQTEQTLKTLNLDFKDFKETLNLDFKVKKGNKSLYSWYFVELLEAKDIKETLKTLNQDFKDFKPTLKQENIEEMDEKGRTQNKTDKTNKGAHKEDSQTALEALQEQLKEKDKQIQMLSEMLKQEQELVKNSQVLLLQAQQKIEQLEYKETQETEQGTESEQRKKDSFIFRIFKRKKVKHEWLKRVRKGNVYMYISPPNSKNREKNNQLGECNLFQLYQNL